MTQKLDKALRLNLLKIKDSDIRNRILKQGKLAIDKSIHIGGAFSLVVPMVSLFYSGCMKLDYEDPCSMLSDKFVLSKGHATAAMCAVFSDLGYFSEDLFINARSYDSILNAHPGPLLPGVHIATGPLGQGISAAVGFAKEQQCNEWGRTFCCVGDGEVQEGIVWEAAMYAGAHQLKNFCVIVDYNHGQNDDVTRLIMSIGDIEAKFRAFGFDVFSVNGTRYDEMVEALDAFADGSCSRPVAIISNTTKGEGGFSGKTTAHKTSFTDEYLDQEIGAQLRRRAKRVLALAHDTQGETLEAVKAAAADMNLEVVSENGKILDVRPSPHPVRAVKTKKRTKKLDYDESLLPKLELGQMLACDAVLSDIMAAFGHDEKAVTVDADMGNITGLSVGMNRTNRRHSFNTGIAESNMMGLSEAFAACGCNVFCGTFGMFLDWRVLRRIAVSQQERLECMERGGWLSEGHELDITFVCASANLDTQTNGATHISIDDVNALKEVPLVKVIDVACPQMLIAVCKWIAEGGKGLVLLRTTRAKSKVIYDSGLKFEYGKAYPHGSLGEAEVVIVSSGRGIYEAIDACELLKADKIAATAVDMPSYDNEMMKELVKAGKRIVFAEQNNGLMFDEFVQGMFASGVNYDTARVMALSTRDGNRERRFLHSATYQELAERTGLDAKGIADSVRQRMKG